MSKSRRDLLQKFNEKQNGLVGIPGILGNRAGEVEVPDRPNYVYVTVGDQVIQAYNTKVPNYLNVGVFIGFDPYQPNVFQVLAARAISGSANSEDTPVGMTPPHHANHEYMAIDGGTDVISVHIRQIIPFRVESQGDLVVGIQQGVIFIGGVWKYIRPVTSMDLSPHLPQTSGKARYSLISLNPQGTYTITDGDMVDINALTLASIPSLPSGNRPIAAIRLYYGQCEIVESRASTDIIDLRFCLEGSIFIPGHGSTHENGGSDEIDVTGLSGILADAQNAGYLQGNIISSSAPNSGQILIFTGTAWEPLTLCNGHTIANNGVLMTQRSKLNIIGASLEDDAVNDSTKVTITGGSGGGHIIQNSGTQMTQRSYLNFVGFNLEDDEPNSATKVSFSGSPGDIPASLKVLMNLNFV